MPLLTRLRPPQILILAFGSVILLGTFLLWLPAASVSEPLSFVDALFTATSATCVTGLIVVDTGSHFTLFGQAVILVLIQLGGLGIMTLGTFFMWMLAGRVGMRERDIIDRTLSGGVQKDLWYLLRSVLLLTAVMEAAGALLLTLRFGRYMPWSEAMYHAVFHSISAFCNAGFSLNADSFIGYRTDPAVSLVLMALIVMGGLGFAVLVDLRRMVFQGRRGTESARRRLTFHTRITLTFTAILILLGAAVFLSLEWGNTLGDVGVGHRALGAFFQSITARTAGFNTVSIEAVSNGSLFLLILLMFIGGAPGSTAGGIKITTFGVIVTMALSRIRGGRDTQLFNRRVPEKTVSGALGIAALGMAVVVVFTFLLVAVETGTDSFLDARGEFVKLFFETVSAFGTVGLSAGSTPELSSAGRLIITALMFIGRLGPLTMAVAVSARAGRQTYRYVEEQIMVG
ncbi:MAG: TrkH family potassium uptake protein [bacterium]